MENDDLLLISRLRAAIADSGMQYKDIAAGAGVHITQVSRFMSKQNITLLTAAKLFQFLKPSITFDTPPPTAPADAPPPAGKPARKRK